MKHRFEPLELLRFVLAFNVVVYHYFFIGPRANWVDAPTIALSYLFFAVHAFFMVSGFVIMFSAAGRTYGEFVLARVARLGPSLLVCATITIAALWLLPLDLGFDRVRAIQWIRSVLVIPLVTGSGVDGSYWSLKYEIIFYGLVAVLIWRGLTEARLLLLVGLMLACDLAALPLAYLGANLKWSPTDHYGAFFCIGILFYLTRKSVAPRGLWPFWAAALVVASIDVSIDLGRTEFGIAAWWQALLVAVGVTTLVGAFLWAPGIGRLGPLCRVLGMASFPLYLAHQNLGFWTINRLERLLGIGVGTARAATIVLMVGFAIAFSLFLEPVLRRVYLRKGREWALAIAARISAGAVKRGRFHDVQ